MAGGLFSDGGWQYVAASGGPTLGPLDPGLRRDYNAGHHFSTPKNLKKMISEANFLPRRV